MCFKRTLGRDHRLDRLMRAALPAARLAYRELDFFEGYGNDERVFGWPGTGKPGVALQRFPFAEYHTSDDIPAVVSPALLLDGVRAAEAFIDLLEGDYVPRFPGPLPPWLTRRGLYFDSKLDTERFQRFNNQVLFRVDGRRSVLDLAEATEVPFVDVHEYLGKFVAQGLIATDEVPWPGTGEDE